LSDMVTAADWSWWTPEEKQAVNRQLRTLAAAAEIIDSEIPNLYGYASLKCFRQDLLEKYRNNELCEIYIRCIPASIEEL
jgi:hypothetical protein